MPRTQIPGTLVLDSSITEQDLSLSDVTTLNADTSRHGFLPKLPNDSSKFLNGIGEFVIPMINTPAVYGYYKVGTNLYEIWYSQQFNGDILSNSASLATNYIFASPFVITRTITIDRIAASVRVASAGNTFYFGIYNDNGSIYPNSLIVQSSQSSANTTGAKITNVNVTLQAGLYWSVFTTSATIAFHGMQANNINFFGHGQLNNDSTPSRAISMIRVPFTFDTLPSQFPIGTISLLVTETPILFFRVSGLI